MFMCAFFVYATDSGVGVAMFMHAWLCVASNFSVIDLKYNNLLHSFSKLNKCSILHPVFCKSGPVSASAFDCISFTAKQISYSSVPFLFFVVVWRRHGARRILARAQAVCGWTRCAAQAMSSHWSSVQKVPGGNTTVCTLRMQECPAILLQVGQHLRQHKQSIIFIKECI